MDNHPKSNRGGKRPGAGRKPKPKLPPSALSPFEMEELLAAEAPDELDKVALVYSRGTLQVLVREVTHGPSESAKVAACKEILDRGWGKPAVEIAGDPMLPFQMKPQSPALTPTAELRVEARKFTRLSLATLERIAHAGELAAARVAAVIALNDRTHGKVGPAKLPDELVKAPLGKKEAQAVAARTASSGIYATPPAPQSAATQH